MALRSVSSASPCSGCAAAERGSATTQVVLVTPVTVLMIMLVFQFALWQHATHVASAAAQRGVRAAQVERGSATSGRAAARAVLQRQRVITAPSVRLTRGTDRTRAVVKGRVVSVVPGFRFDVQGVADGPTERFRPRSQR